MLLVPLKPTIFSLHAPQKSLSDSKYTTSFLGNPEHPYHWFYTEWIKKAEEKNALYLHFMMDDNLSLDEETKARYLRLYSGVFYDRYILGKWIAAEGAIYTNWEVTDFNWKEVSQRTDRNYKPLFQEYYGLDFGFTQDPTALVAMLVSTELREIYVFDEVYKKGLLNHQIAGEIKAKGFTNCRIAADRAEPRTIAELKRLGITGIYGAKKPPDSVRSGIQKLQAYKIFVHPSCENTKIELSNYSWDKKGDSLLNRPAEGYDHLMDAVNGGKGWWQRLKN